jgi:hypothetical protein
VTNGSKEHVDTHDYDKTNNDKQADSYQQNAEQIHVAACDRQHMATGYLPRQTCETSPTEVTAGAKETP